MDDSRYYNLASEEEVNSLYDLALSSKAEDSSFALDEMAIEEYDA